MNLAERLRRSLARSAASAPPIPTGEGDGDEVPAAVLVAITDRPEPGVLLIVRHSGMRQHAGQIACPGGRVDPEDRDHPAAALREAWEELGLEPGLVDIVGTLAPRPTSTGYRITPVVGVVPPDLPLVPHSPEVDDWFEAPLEFLIDPANWHERQVEHQGRQRSYFEIPWNGRNIWGATARILIDLGRRLQWR